MVGVGISDWHPFVRRTSDEVIERSLCTERLFSHTGEERLFFHTKNFEMIWGIKVQTFK